MAEGKYEEQLRSNEGKWFEFRFNDGEKTVGVLLQLHSTGEFIYEMKATNEPKRYANPLGKYSATCSDLIGLDLLDRE